MTQPPFHVELATRLAQRLYGQNAQITTISRLNALVLRLRLEDGSARVLKMSKTSNAAGLEKEIAVHQLLARHGVPGPVVEHVDLAARPPWILMKSAGDKTVLDFLSEDLVREMGRLLARVHRIALEGDAKERVPATPPAEESQLHRLGESFEQKGLLARGSSAAFAAMKLPDPAGEALCHGDFHAVHCVVDQGQITAVVDWGSAWRGNPLIDLAVAQAYLEYYAPPAAPALISGYGDVQGLPEAWPRLSLPVRMAHALGLMHVFGLQQREPNVKRAAMLFGEYLQEAARS